MSLRETWARWLAHRKLARGRCRFCKTILPDDQRPADLLCDDCYDLGVWQW